MSLRGPRRAAREGRDFAISPHPRRASVVGVVLGAVIALSGCASADAGPTSGTSATSLATGPGQGAYADFPAFAEPSTMLEVVEETDDTVVLRSQYGDSEVPKNPERVVADYAAVPLAALLGLPLVDGDLYDLAEIPELIELIESNGGAATASWGTSPEGLDFERVAAARPDLILMPIAVHYPYPESLGSSQEVYDRLSQIAPVVAFNADGQTYWREALEQLGEAMGRSEQAREALATYEADQAAACAPMQEALGAEEVLFLMPAENDGSVTVRGVGYDDGHGSFVRAPDTRWLYEYCGITPPADLIDLVGDSYDGVAVSPELFEQFTTEHIVLMGEAAAAEAITSQPIWQTLPAVQAGQAYLCPYGTATTTFNAVKTAADCSAVINP